MPKYVRENGGIRVIPDDQTTENGEIDLSPRRKIVDEGNVVIEGRDDGSTVIREKRVSDHQFLSNPRSVESEIASFFTERCFYDSNEDLYGFHGNDLSSIDFVDPSNNFSSYSVSLSGQTRSVLPLPSLNKILVATSNEEVEILTINASTGKYESSSFIDISGNIPIVLIPFLPFNKVIIGCENSTVFIDPVDESVNSTTSSGGIDSFSPTFTDVSGYTRSDRIVFIHVFSNGNVYDVSNESVSSLGDSIGNQIGSVYLESVDKSFTKT